MNFVNSKLPKLIIVFLIFTLYGCSKELKVEDTYIFTNIQNEVYLEYYTNSFSSYNFPFILISSEQLSGEISIVLTDSNNIEHKLPFYIKQLEFSEVPYDVKLNLGLFDWKEQIKRFEQLQIIDPKDFEQQNQIISKSNKKMEDAIKRFNLSDDPLFDSYVYFIESDLSTLKTNSSAVFTELIIYSDDGMIYNKEISLKFFDSDSNMKDASMFPRISSRAGFEIPFGEIIEFDYALVIETLSDTKIMSFTLLSEIWKIKEMYIRIYHDKQLQELTLSKDDLSTFELDVEQNTLITFVPRLMNSSPFETPFYFGNFNFEIKSVANDTEFSLYLNSGLISTHSDPFIYKSHLIDDVDYTDLFKYRIIAFPSSEKLNYIDMELDY